VGILQKSSQIILFGDPSQINMEESNKRIVKNTLYLYMRSLLMVAIGLYTSRVVLQVLGVEDYGLYGVIGSVVSMFVIINGVLTAGTSRFLTFELGKGDPEQLNKTFNASFTMHVVLSAILFLLLETIGLLFLNTQMSIPEGRYIAANIVYQLSVLGCITSIIQVPYSAIIVSHERMDIIAYVGLLEAAFKLAFTFALLFCSFKDNLIAYALIISLWSIGLQLWYTYYCIKHFPECRFRFVREKKIYKGMLSYSLWDVIGQFCATGNSQGVNILINMFFGVTFNASRGVAYQVENTITQFVNNFMIAVNPQIVKAYAQNNYNRFFQLIYEAGKYSYFLLFLLTLPIFLEADYILSIWLVEVPEMTVLFLRWVMLITLFRILIRPVINGVHATGDVKTLNLTSGVYSAMTYLPIVYILYRLDFPIWYCFVVQAVNGIICTILEVRSLYLKIPFDIIDFIKRVYFHSIIISLLASILPLIVIILFETSFTRLIITTIVSTTSISFCIFYLSFNAYQRNKAKSYLRNKIQFKRT
jgi:O-antigen/teichoic acid export membrane protein